MGAELRGRAAHMPEDDRLRLPVVLCLQCLPGTEDCKADREARLEVGHEAQRRFKVKRPWAALPARVSCPEPGRQFLHGSIDYDPGPFGKAPGETPKSVGSGIQPRE